MKIYEIIAGLIARILPTASVDKAVSTLVKAANLLAAAEEAEVKNAAILRNNAKSLTEQADVATAAALRARRVREKLDGLLA